MKKTQADKPLPAARSLRALILEDNPHDLERMVALLKGVGYALSFKVVDSLAHLQQQLAQADYDIILADYDLRTWTAMDALETLKKSRKDVPFVVVAGTLGNLAAVECIKQGATDYVLKHRLQHLPVVVERVLRDKAHREEAARLQEQIHSAKKEWEVTFDVIPDPVFLVDRHHRIQRANRAASGIGTQPVDRQVLLRSTRRDGRTSLRLPVPTHAEDRQGGTMRWNDVQDPSAATRKGRPTCGGHFPGRAAVRGRGLHRRPLPRTPSPASTYGEGSMTNSKCAQELCLTRGVHPKNLGTTWEQ
jgi:CheY-like chemotaxis protein